MINSAPQKLVFNLTILGNKVNDVLLGNLLDTDVSHLIHFENVVEFYFSFLKIQVLNDFVFREQELFDDDLFLVT